MNLKIETQFHISLTKPEWLIVQKALRGVLTEEEKPIALALQEQMITQRSSTLGQLADEAYVAVENVERAHARRSKL